MGNAARWSSVVLVAVMAAGCSPDVITTPEPPTTRLRVHGFVLSVNGEPIPNAGIQVDDFDLYSPRDAVVVETRTGADGSYSLDSAPRDLICRYVRLRVQAPPGWVSPPWVSNWDIRCTDRPQEFNFQLEEAAP